MVYLWWHEVYLKNKKEVINMPERKEKKEVEEEVEDNPFTTAKVEKRYLDYLKSKGMSTNEVLRLFTEGKLKVVEEVKEEKQKEEKEERKDSIQKISNKIQEKIEEKGAEQIEKAMDTAMENFQKRMKELEEKAKRADELEKKMIEREINELKEKIAYLEKHKEEVKADALKGIELLKERYKGGGSEERVALIEQKVEELVKKLNKNPIEAYKEELKSMAELKKTLDETFKQIFPDYERRQEKTDWEGMMKVFTAVAPMINNTLNSLIGNWQAMKQIDILLAKAEKSSNPAVAERYMRQADLIMEGIMRRYAKGLPSAGTPKGIPNSQQARGIPTDTMYEDTFVNMLATVSKEEIEKFKEGKVSLIPIVEENMAIIKNAVENNPDLLEQIKGLSVDNVIERLKAVRRDIEVDEKLEARIKSELEAIKQMILGEVGGDDGYGF